MKLSATRRSEAGIGLLGAGGERIREHAWSEEVQGSHGRRACGGKRMAGGGREETTHVSGQDG